GRRAMDGQRAAMNPPDSATPGERLQIAARGGHADRELFANVGYRHTSPLLDKAQHAILAFDIRERAVENHIAHIRSLKHQEQSDYSIGMSVCQVVVTLSDYCCKRP